MRIRLMILLCCAFAGIVQIKAQTILPLYPLGPEDVITVTVLKHPEFSGEFLIPPDGWVNFPVVGKVMVSGKTTTELTGVLVKGLKTRLKAPEVTVTLKTQRLQRIYVLGAVKTPGILDYKAGWRITEALAAAGGTLDNTLQADVTVLHTDGSSTALDLGAILREGKVGADAKLAAGDVVMVQKRYARIAVLGFVNRPGYYDLQDGKPLRLTDAIGMAGGTDSKRGQMGEVAVLHTRGDGTQERKVYNLEKFLRKGEMKQNPEVSAGDVIYVPETRKPDWGAIFQIISSIGITGSLLK
ncbi:MAG: polysaccharide biosynthesis/export family protein [Armatimonadota bacterium]